MQTLSLGQKRQPPPHQPQPRMAASSKDTVRSLAVVTSEELSHPPNMRPRAQQRLQAQCGSSRL